MSIEPELYDALGASLEDLGTLTCRVTARHTIAGAPFGTRIIIDVTDLRIEGERFTAAGAQDTISDWGTMGDGAVFEIDVRAALRTEDEDPALVYVEYHGRVDFSDPAGPGPLLAAGRFQTGDPRYAWLNTVQAVFKGRTMRDTGTVAYRIYALR
jgi:hypothetical protein